jgi:hypothetical protein
MGRGTFTFFPTTSGSCGQRIMGSRTSLNLWLSSCLITLTGVGKRGRYMSGTFCSVYLINE